MLNWILERFGLRIERCDPPHGIKKADTLGVIGSIFEAEAAKAGAQWEITKRNMRRPLPADSWLRQGGAPGGPPGHRGTGDDWLRR